MTQSVKSQIDEVTKEDTKNSAVKVCENLADCRLGMGVVVAVVLIGSFVLMTAMNSPTLQVLPFSIFFLCLVAVVGAIWFYWSSRKD
jgi:hypothetical protein